MFSLHLWTKIIVRTSSTLPYTEHITEISQGVNSEFTLLGLNVPYVYFYHKGGGRGGGECGSIWTFVLNIKLVFVKNKYLLSQNVDSQ